jgi:hypothetical protein
VALSYTCRMGRMGVLAFVALVISVCAVRLPGEHAAMARMAAPAALFNAPANAHSWSVIAEPESPPECCQIQPLLLPASSSIAVLLTLAMPVMLIARVFPQVSRSRPTPNHAQPPGLYGRPALFAALT